MKTLLVSLLLLLMIGCESVTDTPVNTDPNVVRNELFMHEDRYVLNSFVFLDELFKLKYYAEYVDSVPYKKALDSLGISEFPSIKKLVVYKRIEGGEIPKMGDREFTWARFLIPYETKDGIKYDTSMSIFQKLEKGSDYRVNYETGWIHFPNFATNDADVIGIYLEDSTGKLKKGDLTMVQNTVNGKGIDMISTLSIIKMSNYESNNPLMLRNAYRCTENLNTFRIKRIVGGKETDKNDAGEFFQTILGIADTAGKLLYNNNKIFDYGGYVLLPPYRSAADTINHTVNEMAFLPFTNPALGTSNGESNCVQEI